MATAATVIETSEQFTSSIKLSNISPTFSDQYSVYLPWLYGSIAHSSTDVHKEYKFDTP